jgi:hypothetical protein
MAAAAPAPANPLRLEIVSRVGCVWCERLKARLQRLEGGMVEWFESACLDPAAEDYAAQRDALLARAGGRQATYPFVFDAATGALVGGHDATLELVTMLARPCEEPDF